MSYYMLVILYIQIKKMNSKIYIYKMQTVLEQILILMKIDQFTINFKTILKIKIVLLKII